MAAKTDKKANSTLPLNTEDLTPSSNITYNNEVVAIIAGLAANEVEGIAGMCTVSGSIMSKNRNIIVEYGIPIQRAAADAQENVRKAIESMTGLHVVRVDVHVQSVSFEQDKKALQAGAQNAALAAGETEAETVKLPETEQAAPAAAEPEKKPEAKPAEPEVKEDPKPAAAEAPKAKPKAKTARKTETKEKKPAEGKTDEPAAEV